MVTLRNTTRPIVAKALWTVVALVAAAAFFIPFLWMVTSSLRDNNDIFNYLSPLRLQTFIPLHNLTDNYSTLMSGPFGRAIANSLIVAGVSVVVGLIICSMAGFSLAVFSYRGAGLVFAVVVLSFLIPADSIAVPLSGQFRSWGLANTYAGLILPGIGNGLAIFALRQFFQGIPRELSEAARVDGMGWWGIYWKIYLPLSKPALLGAGMMLFIAQWSSYVWPLLMGTDTSKELAPIALANYHGSETTDFGAIVAGSVVLTVIPAAVMFFSQRQFAESVATSGLKE